MHFWQMENFTRKSPKGARPEHELTLPYSGGGCPIGLIQTDLQEAHLMLVLSRKIGERICIGDDVVVTVIQIERNKIRLGIEAPPSVPIWRTELLGKEDDKNEFRLAAMHEEV